MLRALFRILKIIGDMNAICKGTYGQRLVRRSLHRQINKLFR